MLYGSNGTQNTVIFQIFRYLVLFANAGRIHKVEIEAELVVTGKDRVAGRAGNRGYDIPVLPDKGVDDRRFAHIRTTDHRHAGQIVRNNLLFILHILDHQVEQIARPGAIHRRKRKHLIEAQAVKLAHRIFLIGRVYLVNHQDNRLRSPAEQIGHILVHRGQTLHPVY